MAKIRFFQHIENIFIKPVKLFEEEEINQENEDLVLMMQNMVDTHFQDPHKVGVGLAANQIGIPYNLFLCYINSKRAENQKCEPIPLTFWCNASYISLSNVKVFMDEMCFSVLEKKGKDVPRFENILVEGICINPILDDRNKIVSFTHEKLTRAFEGFQARLMQHECDHVNPIKPLFYYNYLENGQNDLIPLTAETDPRTQDERHIVDGHSLENSRR